MAKRRVQALKNVSTTRRQGESFGLVGETPGKTDADAQHPVSTGTPTRAHPVRGAGPCMKLSAADMRRLWARVRIVFSGPHRPAYRLPDIVTEPMVIHHDVRPQPSAQRADRGGTAVAGRSWA